MEPDPPSTWPPPASPSQPQEQGATGQRNAPLGSFSSRGALVMPLWVPLGHTPGQALVACKRPVSVATSCPEPDPSVQASQGSLSKGPLTVTLQSSMVDPAWGQTQQHPKASTSEAPWSLFPSASNCSSQRQSSSARGPRGSMGGDKYTKQARNPTTTALLHSMHAPVDIQGHAYVLPLSPPPHTPPGPSAAGNWESHHL